MRIRGAGKLPAGAPAPRPELDARPLEPAMNRRGAQTRSIVHAPSVPLYRNPAPRPGLAALVGWLLEQRYSSHAIGWIESHVAVHGTLAGSLMEPEDEAAAEEAFVEGQDAVPGDSDAWNRPDACIDVESLLEPRRAAAVEPRAGDRSIPADAAIMPPELTDDLDDDLARLVAEHPVPAAPPASHDDPAAWPDRHSSDALERVARGLAAHDASR
jgi:hypothetical protein